MNVKDLKLNKQSKYNLKKPNDIPPECDNVSPFFVQIICASRGMGKTHSMMMLLHHIAQKGFYNRFITISPTYNSDLKQQATYEDIERMGYEVKHHELPTDDVLDEIQDEQRYYMDLWDEYMMKKQLYEKFMKNGVKKMNDEELSILFDDFLDDEEIIPDREIIFGQYPKWLRRDQPPILHIFIDDCFAENVMTKQRNNRLTKMIVNGRHMLCSLSIATQSLSNIPRAIRSNTQIWCVFPTKAQKDLRVLYEEVANAFPSETHFQRVMREVEKTDYGFLYVDASSLKKPIIKIGFNNVINFTN